MGGLKQSVVDVRNERDANPCKSDIQAAAGPTLSALSTRQRHLRQMVGSARVGKVDVP